MNDDPKQWRALFEQGHHLCLGKRASILAKGRGVKALADPQILVLAQGSDGVRGGRRVSEPDPKAVRSVVYIGQNENLDSRLSEIRQSFPQAEIAGQNRFDQEFADRFTGFDRAVFVAGLLAKNFRPTQDLKAWQGSPGLSPGTAVLQYSPEVTGRAVQQAVEELEGCHGLVSVVPLPTGVGDRIPLPGLTTSGVVDVMLLASLRIALPTTVRVRASWAALGWKVAQVGLAYGADECAGWSAAESLVYSERVRAASRVEISELSEGLLEAGRENEGWHLPLIPSQAS